VDASLEPTAAAECVTGAGEGHRDPARP